jgi:hypothetical protein
VGKLQGLADGSTRVGAADPTEITKDPHGRRFSPHGVESALRRMDPCSAFHSTIWY